VCKVAAFEGCVTESVSVCYAFQSVNACAQFCCCLEMKSPANADPLHPFNFPKEGPRARAFTPDVMERFECAAFPEYAR